ncbi:MAG: HAD-IC family P-type ATPase, partial [Lachnospiraceae bacterium]|nr:HAD-IC family P-type ATPase [Lachnospiraceae bacterium]
KIGVLVKGSNYLEALANVRAFAFDKTGTITEGSFRILDVSPAHSALNAAKLLTLAAAAECYSNHPLARSIVAKAQNEGDGSSLPEVSELKEIPGHGLQCRIARADLPGGLTAGTASSHDTVTLLVGNAKMMAGAQVEGFSHDGTDPLPASSSIAGSATSVICVAVDGVFCGAIYLGDAIRQNAVEAIRALKKAGVRKTIMFTGDQENAARRIAREAGLDDYAAQLLPQDKVACLERIMADTVGVAFVGDGINDAPVLMRADVGIAMGAMGSDAAIEAADVVLMHDDLSRLPQMLLISRKTTRIVKQNIAFAIGVKLIVLCLGAFGIASMWAAVFADVGVAVLAILNAMRSGRIRAIE